MDHATLNTQASTTAFADPILDHELFERCVRCNTTFRFNVTRTQAIDYLPPREKLVQDIFPELPAAARAVLAQNHVCGVCLYQDDVDEQEIARAYIFPDAF